MQATNRSSQSQGLSCRGCGCDCEQAPRGDCGGTMSRREWLGMTVAAASAVMVSPLLAAPETATLEPAKVIAKPTLPKAKILKMACTQGGGEMWESWASPNDRAWLKTDPAIVAKEFRTIAERLGGVEFVGPNQLLPIAKAMALAAERAKDVDGIVIWSASNSAALAPVLELGLPTVIFNVTCHGFDPHWWDMARRKSKNSKVLALSSRDCSELERGTRLLRVPGMLKRSRLLSVGTPAGDADTRDFAKLKAALGLETINIPVPEVTEAFAGIDPRQAEEEAGSWWIRPARKVSALHKDVVGGSRFHLALRNLLASHNAQGIAIDCLGALTAPKMDKEGYPCLGFSRLDDEGWITACQGDIDNAITKLILRYAFDVPCFLGNVYFDTGKGSVVLDHCSSPTRMNGYAAPRLPFDTMTHHTYTGAAPRVYMPVGQTATVARIAGVKGMLFYAARITGNPEGTCRTTVELQPLVGERTPRNWYSSGACGGLHHIMCMGDRERDLRDLCTLMGLTIQPDWA